MLMRLRQSKWFNLFLLIILSLLWGSSFILMKRGLEVFSPFEVASMRILFSAASLLPFLFFIKKVNKKILFFIFLAAVFGSGIPPYLFTVAQTRIDSSVAGILNTLTPLFTLMLGAILFRLPYTLMKVAGVILGLAGSAFLIYMQSTTGLSADAFYAGLVILASMSYGTGANILKSKLQDVTPITISAVAFMMLIPFAGGMLYASPDLGSRFELPGAYKSFFYVGVLGVFCTGYAVILFNMLIQNTNALFASTVTYLIPIVAILWGIADGEELKWFHFGGMAMIILGIYILNRKH